jgi:phenylacetate-CoA ligase
MYGVIYRNLFLKKGNTLTLLRKMEKNQWLPEGDLKELQWQKLKRLLRHSYDNVPFYRNRFESAGVSPDDIMSLRDLGKLPFLTRRDIQDNMNSLTAENLRDDRMPVNKSGGSTGEPLKFFIHDRITSIRRPALYGHIDGQGTITEKRSRLSGGSLS